MSDTTLNQMNQDHIFIAFCLFEINFYIISINA